MESRDNLKGHRRSQTDSFFNYSFGSMSQDFLSSGNDLGGTFDDLDGVDGGVGISTTGGDDVASSLVGSKHLRSLSFTDSRDLGDVEANNDIFIINSNPPGPPELDTGLGHMSPPQGVPYRQKKSIRAKRPGTNSPSAGPSHRRIKSMSSASTDQMMQDCFRRDPNVTLNELPDLGSMSMESSDLMKFTSEDWQEAFIQIGRDSEGDISGTAPGGQALPRRSLGSMDSTLGISMLNSGSPAKDTLRHMPLPPGATAGKNSGVSRAPVLIDQGSCIKNEGDSVLREFQQRGSLSRTSPTSDVLNDEYASFMHVQAQLFAPPSVRPSSPSSNTSFIMPKPSTSSKDHKKGHGRSNNTDGANGGTASGKRGISDPEYHNGPNGSTKTEDYIDTDKKSTNRGKYRCGRCGQPKVNHQCPYEIEASTRSISTQAVRQTYVGSAHPFLTEKTIVVRKRLPPTQDTSDVDSMPSESSVDRGRPPTTSLAGRSPKQGQGQGQGQGPGQIKTEHSAAGMVAPTKVGPNQLSPVLGTHRKNSVKQENVLTKTKSGAVKSFSSPNGSTKQQNVSPQVSRGYNQNLAKSTSSDGSLYNDMLKDIRIVHPSLQRPSADSHQLATVSTDESDSNSLFLSSLSSHSSAADDNS